MKNKRIVVIGLNTLDDYVTIEKTATWLENNGRRSGDRLGARLRAGCFDAYDMATKPEKGDALDHIGPDVGLVVALHLYGIDQIPGKQLYGMDLPYTYCKRNGELLQVCMGLHIPLVCWGDQPWLGVERKEVQIHENNLWAYLPGTAAKKIKI